MTERLALIHSDGSISVFGKTTTLDYAREESRLADRGEKDPAHFTKIARIEVKILEIIDAPALAPSPVDTISGRQADALLKIAYPAELAMRLYEANSRQSRSAPDAIAALAAMEMERAQAWLRSAKAAADYFVELLDVQRRK
jgi:hypothetical protein